MTQPVASYEVSTRDADRTRAFGEGLGRILTAGDLLTLSGGLDAGKTTLTQGISAGMDVRGRVASPTFIVARVHPSLSDGPDLIHADAYRITDLNDLETLDLDSSLGKVVIVVEWGKGKTEAISDERLSTGVRRALGGEAAHDGDVIDLENMDDGTRVIVLHAHGHRWDSVLDDVVAAHGGTRIDEADTDEQDHTVREIALDTQAATTVAIIDDGCVLGRTQNDPGRHHAESITPLVRGVLATAGPPTQFAGAGIDRVLVDTGPAPFIGLCVGLVSARVLAPVAGVPAYGVSALDAIARQGLDRLPPDTRVYVIADACRRELCWGLYVAAGPDDVTLEGRLEVGDVSALLDAVRTAPGLVAMGTPIPAHNADALACVDLRPRVSFDPAVMSRIVAMCLSHGEDDRLRTDPLYLRRPGIQGQPTARL